MHWHMCNRDKMRGPSDMSLRGHLYRIGICVIWVAGVVMFVRTWPYLVSGPDSADITQQMFDFIALAAGVVGSSFTIFSFLAGAQPGHWVRAAFVVLVTIMLGLLYLGERAHNHGVSMPLMFIAAGLSIYLSRQYRSQFFEQFRRQGKTNYFQIYFGKHSSP